VHPTSPTSVVVKCLCCFSDIFLGTLCIRITDCAVTQLILYSNETSRNKSVTVSGTFHEISFFAVSSF
jgi:hypothetical protein